MSRGRYVIGVTGGIATGKTAVLAAIRRRGIPTIASDDLAHACLRRGHPCQRKVIAHFGPAIAKGGEIQRKRLGAIVFADPKERRWLERQIHPHVRRQLRAFIRKHHGIVAVDIPLLFEAGLTQMVDAVLVVSAPRAEQIARLRRRDGLDRRAALQRMRAQWPLAAKTKRADYVLFNHKGLRQLRQEVDRLLANIRTAGRKA